MLGYADSETIREQLAAVAFPQQPFLQLELAREARAVLDNQWPHGLTRPASIDL